MAVVRATQYFKQYLFGRRFRLQTDHTALKWLFGKSDLSGRLSGWVTILQEYAFDVEHIPGTKNRVADALSRQFESEEEAAEEKGATGSFGLWV